MSNLVCIGSGNMAYALINGAAGSIPGTSSGVSIYFTDIDFDKAKAAAASLKTLPKIIHAQAIKSNAEEAGEGDFIFLAVKPQVMQKVLAEITPAVQKRVSGGTPPVLVSMAAGWPIEKIQAATGVKVPVVRTMPNTPALIGKGMIAIAPSSEVPQDKIKELEKLLSGTGIVDIIDEQYMDAVTALSGSGPAFVYLFIEALADGGVKAGLPRDKALRYAAQTVIGSAAMVQETGKHPGELKDMVTSPGGTTIAGIAALEEGAFRGTVIKAVEAAWERAMQLAINQ